MVKRGPLAWENYDKFPLRPLGQGGFTRLLTHAVGDSTAAQWLPKVKGFLLHRRRSQVPMATSTQVDEALAEHFDWLCYSQRAQPTAGSQIFFGLLTIMPELRGDLPLAARSLKSWSKLAANSEGGPTAEEAIYAIFITMLQAGMIIEAIWVLTQYDAYARGQDIEGLRVADIFFFDGFASLEFGVSQRGESAKFAANQGVIIRRGAVTDMLLALRSTAPPNGRIFPITQASFRMAWHRVSSTWTSLGRAAASSTT